MVCVASSGRYHRNLISTELSSCNERIKLARFSNGSGLSRKLPSLRLIKSLFGVANILLLSWTKLLEIVDALEVERYG